MSPGQWKESAPAITGDDMLENNEQMVITVDLSGLDYCPELAYGTFTIQIVPPAGACYYHYAEPCPAPLPML